jgi:hypothetical protein
MKVLKNNKVKEIQFKQDKIIICSNEKVKTISYFQVMKMQFSGAFKLRFTRKYYLNLDFT